MKPLTPVSPGARIALGIGFFVAFVALWSVVTFGGLVQKTFLADPWTMLDSGWTLLVEHGFAHDIGMTVFRVLGGFLIAALIAVPLGVAMGPYKPIEAFFEPCRLRLSSRCSSCGWALAKRRSSRSSSSAASSSWC